MLRTLISLLVFLVIALPVSAADGLMQVDSNYTVSETADRLEKVLKSKGMTVFNRINHAKAAMAVGVDLRPTELIIFGNPKVGSPLMECQQTIGIDLPQKALIWEDVNGMAHISYNDPAFLKMRHDVSHCDEVFTKVGKALNGITQAAATGE